MDTETKAMEDRPGLSDWPGTTALVLRQGHGGAAQLVRLLLSQSPAQGLVGAQY